MIPSLRQQFNENFTADKYRAFLRRVDEVCGTHVQFRLSETPCFFPKMLLERMADDGQALIRQLMDNPAYRAKSDEAVPPEFKVPNEAAHPMFAQVDFGLVRDAHGELQPKLVELQAFPSLYAYQGPLAQAYIDGYGLRASGFRLSASGRLKYFLSGLETESYRELLRRAIVGAHDPENVILMEIHPREQKTLPDFLMTEKMLGVRTVDIVDIKKDGSRLYYERGGKRIPIQRIYNRTIVDELERKNVKLQFDWRDDLDVEWAGHPNWYFRISKFSIPYLKHASVPKTWFLDRMDEIPSDLENYALKPLYSFAGLGVVIAPTKADIAAIPAEKRPYYIFQERMYFEPVIETPFGGTKAEVRVMYIWLEDLTPVLTIIRMGRGLMMGVDQNKNMEWVGASAGMYFEE
jgi:limonene-1,2-epoxide hydrolase